MENVEYYQSLAKKVFFYGIVPKDVTCIADYKNGKTWPDLVQAVRQGRLEGLGKFENEIGGITRKLYEVLDINTEAFDNLHGKPI